ncbi:ABC transporter permease [Natronoarchaeum rubrum]|uniref:ABC transporter permease n=1 Tax=Natronoarchaeum rubrum TaxID=755311 RepID=UPI0021110037|nr:ABC transporter permease [Natronoarchaeum rubrum]
MATESTATPRSLSDYVSLQTLGQYGPILGLVGLYLFFALNTANFMTYANQVNLLRQVSIIGILAIGSTFVILAAEIDLSIAEMMEFTGLLIASLATGGLLSSAVPIPLAILAGLAAAVVLGGISGYVTSRFGVPSFMTTLAMLFLADGFGQIVSSNRPIIGLPDALLWLGSGSTFGFPNIVITFLVLLAVSQIILSYTRFGLYLYAVGGDADAAELMGINVKFLRMGVLVLSAVFTVIAGIVMMGRIGSATPNMGSNLLLPPIAAVILGGTDLFGGKGNMIGTLIGVLILGSLSNGLNLMGVDPAGQLVAQGVVLMIAVLANVAGDR